MRAACLKNSPLMRCFPRKRDYRPRAHCNPFAEEGMFVPCAPDRVEWERFYTHPVPPSFLDVGCGYGRFLVSVASRFSEKNICGIEIRRKVAEFTSRKIHALRESEDTCANAHVIHTNALLFLPNIFAAGSLEKVFVLFPDPQFKKRKRRARIVSKQMADIYAYILAKNGRLYISTDVAELFEHMAECLADNGSFARLSESECQQDELFLSIYMHTDESLRAAVKTKAAYAAIFQKTT